MIILTIIQYYLLRLLLLTLKRAYIITTLLIVILMKNMQEYINSCSFQPTSETMQVLCDKLLDMSELNGHHIPSCINPLVSKDRLKENKYKTLLLKYIIDFMHRKTWLTHFEFVKIVIETCPRILAVVDKDGCAPIHLCCTCKGNRTWDFIPLMIKAGAAIGVGGTNSKGGLLGEFHDYFKTCIIEEWLTLYEPCDENCCIKDIVDDIFKLECFKSEDIQTNGWIEHALSIGLHSEIIKKLVDLHPACLYAEKFKNGPNTLVLAIQECRCRNFVAEEDDKRKVSYILCKALKYDPKHSTIGGLLHYYKDHYKKRYMNALKVMVLTLGEREAWDIIENALSPYDGIRILHEIINHAPDQILNAFTRFPNSVFLREKSGRLPIHLALAKGIKWSNPGFVSIMYANIDHLKGRDPVTNQYPFLLAARKPSCDLKTIFHLAKLNPPHVRFEEITSDFPSINNANDSTSNNERMTNRIKRRRVSKL